MINKKLIWWTIVSVIATTLLTIHFQKDKGLAINILVITAVGVPSMWYINSIKKEELK